MDPALAVEGPQQVAWGCGGCGGRGKQVKRKGCFPVLLGQAEGGRVWSVSVTSSLPGLTHRDQRPQTPWLRDKEPAGRGWLCLCSSALQSRCPMETMQSADVEFLREKGGLEPMWVSLGLSSCSLGTSTHSPLGGMPEEGLLPGEPASRPL